MKTSRIDVDRDKKQIFCPNASILGYSRHNLNYSDFFIYKDETGYRLAKCHGQIFPMNKCHGDKEDVFKWWILGQVVSHSFSCTYERWIDPQEVIETIPAEHMNKHIIAFFEEKEEK